MSRKLQVSVAFGVALALLAASVPLAASKSSHPECIGVWGEARYRNYGYDHIVHVANRCAAPALCDVSTDLNPTVQHVSIPPNEEVEVLTFRGSPSRDFVVKAECRLVL